MRNMMRATVVGLTTLVAQFSASGTGTTQSAADTSPSPCAVALNVDSSGNADEITQINATALQHPTQSVAVKKWCLDVVAVRESTPPVTE